MRAALHDTFGDPTVVLHGGEAPVPKPAAGEVRIRTVLAPIHNHDLWTVRGQYGYKPGLPAIGGSEGTGVVDALGEGVTGLAIGQRVSAASVHAGQCCLRAWQLGRAVHRPGPDGDSDAGQHQR